MKFKRSLLVSLCFFVIAVVVAVWLYPRLPAEVPRHWDLQGHVNGTMPRLWGAAMPALWILGLAGLTWLLPVISPRRFEIKPFAQVFVLVMLLVQALVLVVGLASLLSAVGYPVVMHEVVMLGVGALFLILGNYMGKLRKNFFIGIRTPWTLASDAVWERTHRLGGWLFMLAGVVMIAATLLGAPASVAIGAIV
ncbi:MAG: SdpI family protein, partial [Rhodanobacter sp.]